MEGKKKTFKKRLLENLAKNKEIDLNDSRYKEEEEDLVSKKMKVQLYNCNEVFDQLYDFVYNDDKNKCEAFQSDFHKTKYNSVGSFSQFYSKLKKFSEFSRKELLNKKTPSFNLINALKESNLVPNPTGILKRNGEENIINLNNMKMGDQYMKCLSKSLKLADHLTELHLSGNRITNQGITPLLLSINDNYNLIKRVSVLDLSFNKLGREGINSLIELIQNTSCELTHLNLEANCLGNQLISLLVNEIVKNLPDKIKYLNFGQNNLNDDICLSLANMIEQCQSLQVLILYWNQFKNYGAAQIIGKLKAHKDIKVIDLGWNLIGANLLEQPTREELNKMGKDDSVLLNLECEEIRHNMEILSKKKLNPIKNMVSMFAKELGQLFKGDCRELVHLDISHNNIGFVDSQYISEEVKYNHTILGIHVDGNDMTIDSLGFINPIEKGKFDTAHYANSQVYYKIDNDHPLIKTNVLNVRKIRAKNNCWICEGWREIKFSYKPIHQENINSYKVKLHLSFEEYKQTEMLLNQDIFVNYRMCPPGEYFYYYTVNGEPVENYGSSTEILKDAIIHKETYENGELFQYIITKVAKLNILINPSVIDSKSYKKILLFCEPRPEKEKLIVNRPRTPWEFKISIWAAWDYSYEGEQDIMINDAFEYDFNRCQFSKDSKNEEQLNEIAELKEYLREFYKKILDCYKNLSGYMGSSIWQINQSTILEFANNCPDLIDANYDKNGFLLQDKAVKSTLIDRDEKVKNKNKNIPDNLIRHQFLNLLVRVAKDKYITRSKTFTTLFESVKYTFENHYIHTLGDYNNQKWKHEKYYKEYVDNVIKAYLPIFDAVYKSWAPRKDPGRRDTWMILEEFTNLMINLVENDFPVREIPICFNLSMRLQVNEIDSDRHYCMLFPEFMEAFCRVIDKSSPVPPNEDATIWTTMMRQEQPLSIKLEHVMSRVIKQITNSEFKLIKEKFVLPIKNEETGLLKYDLTSPFYINIWPKSNEKWNTS